MKTTKGLHEYRFKDNPHEKIAAELWAKQRVLPYLLADDPGAHPAPTPSDRDATVAATLMQWLGSPVGRCFFRDLAEAFEAEDKKMRRRIARGR